MDHNCGSDICLAKADSITEHCATILFQLREQTLRRLALVGGFLVGFGKRVEATAFSKHLADHPPQAEHGLFFGGAFIQFLNFAADVLCKTRRESLSDRTIPTARCPLSADTFGRINMTELVAWANMSEE